MEMLPELLAASAARHRHLCPRQVLGVRMGLLAGSLLDVELPRRDKRLLVIMETDGCAVDGVAVATGCSVGRRTLRVEDYGKVAATFIDTRTGEAVRLSPQPAIRARALALCPGARSPWHAQLQAYQLMPEGELLAVQPVALSLPLARLVSQPGRKATCARCGEEILNEREVLLDGRVLCRACAGDSYYRCLDDPGG